jgi:D-psicose/D-tagatose/L-ribulose 3-epimerase
LEQDPVGAIAPYLALINHVHLAENDRGTPGRGHVPFEATFRACKTGGYDGWFVIEAFGRALPALAAATRVWRDFFPHREEVYRSGHDYLREVWASPGASRAAAHPHASCPLSLKEGEG